MTQASLMNDLPRLALLLNSTRDYKRVISIALEYFRKAVNSEAATLFLVGENGQELTFWASKGGEGPALQGKKMPMRGIVGWTIQNKRSATVRDTKLDARFFHDIDKETSFTSKNILCIPLFVRGSEVIGAIEAINSLSEDGFSEDDEAVGDVFAHLTALAVDNAKLIESLERKTNELRELNRKKDDILTIISHEFRTPLNIIKLSSELLLNDMVTKKEDVQMLTVSLDQAINQLVKRVDEAKNISLCSQGQISVVKKGIGVTDLIDRCISFFAQPLKNRSLTFTFLPSECMTVQADESLVTIALCNLISNSIRFTHDGGSITVSAAKSLGFLYVTVTDTGIGIDKLQHDAVFNKFFENVEVLQHSSGDFSFKSAGLGLGLSVARTIARSHGGDVVIKTSEKDKGSSFSLSIPAT